MLHIPEPNTDSILKIKDLYYLFFNSQPFTIFEFGARYCEDSLEMSINFPNATIISFECNPNTLPECREKIKSNPNIKLIETAVGNHDGTITFYPINKEKTITTWEDGNQGASSIFKASGNYPVEQYYQDEIEVPIKRPITIINELNIDQIDLLWMDIQGSELLALEGFEDKLSSVKLIFTEVEFVEIYSGQPLFKDIKQFLENNDFSFIQLFNESSYAADAIFINNKFISKNKIEEVIALNKVDAKKSNIFNRIKKKTRSMLKW